MKDRFNNFNNIFNCSDCNKTLWRVKTLPNGKKVCPKCYEEYIKIENDKKIRKKAYIDLTSRDLIDKDLSDLVYNFFQIKYNNNPNELEIEKLWKLLKNKYKIEIEYDSFFEIIRIVYNIIKEKKELQSFEQEINPKKKPIETNNFSCVICETQIDKQTYEYSINNFNKALCTNHQGTKYHRDLFFALKSRRIPCEFEAYDGHKHIDIAIHDIKLYIEVDGPYHSLDPKQFLADLKRDRFSREGGYQTRRFNNEFIEKHLDEIADILRDVYLKFKNG